MPVPQDFVAVRCAIRPLLILGVLLAMIGSLGCSHYRQLRKEAVLREQLAVLNHAAERFTADHGRPPESLADLLFGGYLKELPVDPFTGRSDSWRISLVQGPANVRVEVHSGSTAISSTGTAYDSW